MNRPKKDFREPDLKTPAEVKEKLIKPVKIADPAPQGLVESIQRRRHQSHQKSAAP